MNKINHHYLYRHFDKDGKLLYVGIALSVIDRLRSHRGCSFWFHDISTITIEKFSTRKEVLDAEKIAIKNENPSHNIMHSLEKNKMSIRAIRQELLDHAFGISNQREECREEKDKAGMECKRESCYGCRLTVL